MPGEEPPDREGMLPGEDFRGGHEHGLISMGHGQQHRIEGHDRLAAAHVALQEAVHRQRPAHVGPDLGDRLPLALGQLEREEAADAGIDQGRGLQRRGLPQLVLLMPPDGQRQPQQEKLLVGQSPPRAGQLFGIVGGVDLLDRPVERPEIVGLQILVGKDLFQQLAKGGDRLGDDLPHLPLLQALGERIDRQDPPLWFFVLLAQPIDLGMRHLPDQALQLGLAGEHHALPDLELLLHERLIEPQPAKVPAARADEHAQHALAGLAAAEFHVFDDAADALQLVFLELLHLAEIGHVLIGPREEEEHVAGRLQIEPLKHFGALRAHAFQELHRRGELFGGGFVEGGHDEGYCTRCRRGEGERSFLPQKNTEIAKRDEDLIFRDMRPMCQGAGSKACSCSISDRYFTSFCKSVLMAKSLYCIFLRSLCSFAAIIRKGRTGIMRTINEHL